MNDLRNVLSEIENSNIRGLIFKAQGDNFSGGADVNMFADRTPEQARDMFDTEDLQNGVASFLKNGPGQITFKGK